MSVHSARRPKAKRSALIRIGLFSAVGAVLFTLLLFLAAFLALRNDWNGMILTVTAYVCCAVSAFLCSFFCAKSAPDRKALYGLLSVLPTLLLLLVLCIAMYGKIGVGFAVACLLTILSAALGSILAIRKKAKPRYKSAKKIGAVR